MATGTVKWFNDAKGYGFIAPSDGGKDVFVHYTAVTGEGFKTLTEGAQVEFEVEQGDKGPQAQNVDRSSARSVGSRARLEARPLFSRMPAPDHSVESPAEVRPRFRGVSHQLAFFVAVPLAVAFALLPDTPEGRASAIVYGVAVAFMFGASGAYHRIWWSRPLAAAAAPRRPRGHLPADRRQLHAGRAADPRRELAVGRARRRLDRRRRSRSWSRSAGSTRRNGWRRRSRSRSAGSPCS